MEIPALCYDEKEFFFLEVASYNDNNVKVCTFIDNERYIESITPNVSMILVGNDIEEKLKGTNCSYGFCIVEN